MDSFEKRLEKDILQDHITALYAPRIIAEVGFFFLYKQHAHAEIVTVTGAGIQIFHSFFRRLPSNYEKSTWISSNFT